MSGASERASDSARSTSSELPRFYRLSPPERRARLAELCGLDPTTLAALQGSLRAEDADSMIENAIGVFGVPLGVCVNLLIDGEDRVAPMAIEEPSVVAAASHAAKLLRCGGGLSTRVSAPIMVGQVQLLDVRDPMEAERRIEAERQPLIELANSGHGRLVAAGGGAQALEIHHLPPCGRDDPLPAMMIVHLLVDVREAMGANAVNSMCEALAPHLERLTGGRVRLRILSNLCRHRLVSVRGAVPFADLDGGSEARGRALAEGIVEASVFAERDPYRAATHNKGIMNGVDAVLLACGQDWRAVEAGAHAFAAEKGRYGPLARWRMTGARLEGHLEMPMAVGVVGGVVPVHPTVQAALRLGRIDSAQRLTSLAAAVGLAQNLGALRALAGEGIQRGHMRLHARKRALELEPRRDHHQPNKRRLGS